MCGRARAFYGNLFFPDPTDPNACKVLWDKLPTVSVGDRDWLELPLTVAEFLEALRCMPTNKSPGMDGLTVEFYRVFWDVLGPDLVTIWAESLQSRVLPLSCRRAGLPLLLKKRDLCDLRNWCPISLLSMDYKVVAKAILLWLGSVLADVVHPDQTYSVPERTIFDNLYLVWDFLELKLVLSVYANDVLLLVQDLGDLAQVEACQTIYLAASSTQVNWVKSSGLVVGDRWQASSLLPMLQAICSSYERQQETEIGKIPSLKASLMSIPMHCLLITLPTEP
ncbi:unnamed protein product [Caretta caretta]